jgi:Rod binding domain-containing protein
MTVEPNHSMIGTTLTAIGHVDAPTLKGDSNALRSAVDGFVGSVFYGEMLKQLRESPFQSELFNGGHGEKVFQSQLDGILAERAGVGKGFDLNEALYQTFATRQYESTPGNVNENEP